MKPGTYVKKGDLIVSGDILLNENVVSTVCASAKVYAESWYTVNEKIPLKYTKEVVTNKKRNIWISKRSRKRHSNTIWENRENKRNK